MSNEWEPVINVDVTEKDKNGFTSQWVESIVNNHQVIKSTSYPCEGILSQIQKPMHTIDGKLTEIDLENIMKSVFNRTEMNEIQSRWGGVFDDIQIPVSLTCPKCGGTMALYPGYKSYRHCLSCGAEYMDDDEFDEGLEEEYIPF